MTAVVQAVGNAVSSIGHAVEQAGSFVGHTLEKVAQGAASNPVGTLARVAAIATGQVWALPIISAVDTVAHGGSIGQAVLNAGASYVGSWVAGADGLNVANAVGGGTVGDLASGLVRGGVTSAISGKDIVSGALTGALEQGIGGAVRDALPSDVVSGTLGATGAMMLGKTLGGATSAAIQGKDVEQGAASGLAGGLFNWGANGFGGTLNNVSDYLKNNFSGDDTNTQLQGNVEQLRQMGTDYASNYQSANDSYTQYNDLAKQYNDALSPEVDKVKVAQADYDKSVADYNALYQQYQDAQASGQDTTDLVKSLEDQYKDYQAKEKVLTDTYDGYTQVKDQNAGVLDQANQFKATYDSSVAKLNDITAQAPELQKQLEADVQAYTDTQNRQSLENAGQALESAQQPFAQFAGTQQFDDGSSIQTFDDGSMLVTDSEGNISSVDSSGDTYDQQGNPTTASDSKAKDYSSVFRSLLSQSAGARGARVLRGSNKAIGKPAVASAGALGATASRETNDEVDSSIPSQDIDLQGNTANSTNRNIYNPYDFLSEKSHMTYIPGVSEALGFKGNQQGVNTILGGAQPKPQAYSFYEPEAQPQPTGLSNLTKTAFDYQQPNVGQISGYESPAGAPDFDPYATDYLPYAQGGSVFMSEGGQRYVQGGTTGTEDAIDAKLSDGEFVVPADVVSALGNGNNEAGAGVLDQFVRQVRAHKQENGVELPPDAKTPLQYIAEQGGQE